MRIIGIDPGTGKLGYAAIEKDARGFKLLAAETVSVPRQNNSAERLLLLEKALDRRLKRDRPDAVVVEKIFFAKNSKTAIAVAEARGIILLTALRRTRNIWECTPLEVKLAATGYGRADKNQVRKMVCSFFPNEIIPPGDDAVDAIAIAIAGIYYRRPPS